MKLTLKQLKSIATGVSYIEEKNGKFSFHRFTKEQEQLYKTANLNKDNAFYTKTFFTSGVRLQFKTNSQTLTIKADVLEFSTRKYFSFDLFVNNKPKDYIDNFSDITLPADYTRLNFPTSSVSKTFSLGDGEKEVCLYFPWSVYSLFEEISLDDGAYITPVKPSKKLLAFGDSITQGYDALRPSNRYISILANMLGVEEFNKAIGGEVFFPALAKTKDDFEPDYITVAYGTNDFARGDEAHFKKNCRDFYVNLSKNYPNSKIFAITPIWRSDYKENRGFSAFENVEKFIYTATADLKNVTVISGFDFVPKDKKYYADLRLHPNDEGFAFYAKNLYNEIIKYI